LIKERREASAPSQPLWREEEMRCKILEKWGGLLESPSGMRWSATKTLEEQGDLIQKPYWSEVAGCITLQKWGCSAAETLQKGGSRLFVSCKNQVVYYKNPRKWGGRQQKGGELQILQKWGRLRQPHGTPRKWGGRQQNPCRDEVMRWSAAEPCRNEVVGCNNPAEMRRSATHTHGNEVVSHKNPTEMRWSAAITLHGWGGLPEKPCRGEIVCRKNPAEMRWSGAETLQKWGGQLQKPCRDEVVCPANPAEMRWSAAETLQKWGRLLQNPAELRWSAAATLPE
jgi:hypothetical protein